MGTLWFGDGSQKMTAAMMVLLALLMLDLPDAELADPQMLQLVSSLMRIRTLNPASTSSHSQLDAMVGRIATCHGQ